MSQWRVEHASHSNISYGEATPNDLQFGFALSEVNFCNYSLSLSDPLAVKAYTRPYESDFLLYRDNNLLMGGIHTDIQIDPIQRTLQISGKEWLHHLERRQWFFNPADPTGNLVVMFQADLFDVVKTLLDGTLALGNSLSFTYNFGTSGVLTNFRIDPADQDTILTKIQSLADAHPGFDYECTPDRVIHLYSPRKDFDSKFVIEAGKNVTNVQYSEAGPEFNHLLAVGQGSTSRFGILKDDLVSKQTYRRLDGAVDYGDITNDHLQKSATTDITRGKDQIFTLICDIIPDESEDFWNTVEVGYTMRVYAPLEWDTIDDTYRLVSMSCQITDTGDEHVQLTFNDKLAGM